MQTLARVTKQRKAVLRAVRTLQDHPTAEHVFAEVQREIPQVSLGTVYRNLQRLVADGELALAPVGDRTARYDPMTAPHDHFVCEHCGAIFDVLRERAAAVDFQHLQSEGFEVRSHALSVFGFCPICTDDLRGSDS